MNKIRDNLKNNEYFCSAPWSQLHILPDGSALPCCMWDYSKYEDGGKFGNINDYSNVSELLNNSKFCSLRQSFVANKKEPGCHRCYYQEKFNKHSSFRSFMNSDKIMTDAVLENVLSMSESGEIDKLNVTYLDIRFGNICNFKCRMCGHHLSSSWFNELMQESKIVGSYLPEKKFIHVNCYDKIEPLLDTVTEIYFAGGEPTLYPEHLKILDRLIEVGNTTLNIRYNTNMSNLKYKGRDFIQVWEKFDNVSIGASIDDQKEILSYIRTGADWNQIYENMNRLIKDTPHIKTVITPTIGIINIETFPIFHKFAIENGWCSMDRYTFGYIDWPQYMNIKNLPVWYQNEMIKIYSEHKNWLIANLDNYNVKDSAHIISNVEELIKKLQLPCNDDVCRKNLITLKEKLELWKLTANIDWEKSIPHIHRLLENIID